MLPDVQNRGTSGIIKRTSHLVGRTLSFEWSVNRFIMDYFKVQSDFSVKRTKKTFTDNHYKLFTDQSELSTLPAWCNAF